GQIPYGAQQGSYGQAPPNPYGQAPQNPYGQAQNPYGQAPQNPYAQAPQNPYGTPGSSNYGPPPKKGRGNLVLVGRIVGAVVALSLVVGGYLVKKHNDAARSSDGTISKQGDLDAFSLKTGDCFEKPKDATTGFSSVKAIPCDQPHNSQIIFSFTYPNATKTEPTDDERRSVTDAKCGDAENTLLDTSKVPQNAGSNSISPDSKAWESGRHEIQCVVENDTDFTGSVLKG
ncbi:MAG: hypothetical protein HOW97_36430, partial [Catenulispora sp.]|nr:hypothetical protein [Catenulispora sp.]